MTRTLRRPRAQAAHAVTYATVTLMLAGPARAAGSSMPREAPPQSILESIKGPVAKIIAVTIIIVTGLTLAFGDTSGGFRRLIQIVFGISIAIAASSLFLSFFSSGGGALIRWTETSGSLRLGIHPTAWDEAVGAMTEGIAFIALLVLDRNRFHPDRPVASPGGGGGGAVQIF